jgi:SNF2 family DNA or RNA helicase
MPWGRQIKGINKARKVDLQRILAPMLLRRETDILGDQLPPVRFELIEYDLAGDHREAYDKARKELLLNWETVQKNYVSVAAAASDLRLLVAAPRCLDIAVDSPKDEIIERLVDDHLKNDHQLVVYGWHKKYVAHLIAKLQKTFGSPVVAGASALDSPAARMRAVDEFKKGARRVLVTSIGISGTGTDLPNARAVIFGEGDWTPAVIEQAWKRIHRIGQKHSSVVYFPVARRTIESDIYRTYVQKTAMAESILMLDAVRRALFEEG